MQKVIEENISIDKKYFYLTGLLSEVTGQLVGNVYSMRDDNLTSLDKKYFADKIEAINNKLIEFREFLYDQEMQKVIEENISIDKKYFYFTGLLSEATGQLVGNVYSMRDDNLTSLDKKYFADKIEAINNKLIEFRDSFMIKKCLP